jgi:hypothetical protein
MSSSPSAEATSDLHSSVEKQQRYNLRGKRTALTPSDDISVSRESSGSARAAQIMTSRRQPKANPLDNLLREKRQLDRKGKGPAAFAEAEQASSNLAWMRAEMDAEEDDSTDEDAALDAIQRVQNSMLKSSSPTTEDEVLDQEDRSLLRGDKGAAVRALLAEDRKNRKNQREEQVVGINLWLDNSGDQHMESFEDIPKPPNSISDDVMLHAVSSALLQKGTSSSLSHQFVSHLGSDTIQATLMLNSGVLLGMRHFDAAFSDYFLKIGECYYLQS